ncbi:zinc ribbon domain-containing protein [Methanomethylovorans sp.]|uniref:zinc ribbon domain-containing protein n=1 Tax=Methanomethylovorans sp. TaxID=2758717 RepID=UPI00351C7397
MYNKSYTSQKVNYTEYLLYFILLIIYGIYFVTCNILKAVRLSGWITTYKAEWAGKRVELVNPRNTSQVCSGCGQMVRKDLSERTHSCPFCSLVLDRDQNAAINILRLGLQSAAQNA